MISTSLWERYIHDFQINVINNMISITLCSGHTRPPTGFIKFPTKFHAFAHVVPSAWIALPPFQTPIYQPKSCSTPKIQLKGSLFFRAIPDFTQKAKLISPSTFQLCLRYSIYSFSDNQLYLCLCLYQTNSTSWAETGFSVSSASNGAWHAGGPN